MRLAFNLGFGARELRRVESLVSEHQTTLLWHGKTTSEPRAGERVRDVHINEDVLSVDLFDGRTISVPLAWFPRLLHASPEERAKWRIAGGGYGIHWPDLDEDLSTAGLLGGAPAPGSGTAIA